MSWSPSQFTVLYIRDAVTVKRLVYYLKFRSKPTLGFSISTTLCVFVIWPSGISHISSTPELTFLQPWFVFQNFCFTARQPLVGHGLLIKGSRSYSDTPHSVGLLWTSDQTVAETSTWQHTTLTTDRYPCPRRNWNQQSQQVRGRSPHTVVCAATGIG